MVLSSAIWKPAWNWPEFFGAYLLQICRNQVIYCDSNTFQSNTSFSEYFKCYPSTKFNFSFIFTFSHFLYIIIISQDYFSYHHWVKSLINFTYYSLPQAISKRNILTISNSLAWALSGTISFLLFCFKFWSFPL